MVTGWFRPSGPTRLVNPRPLAKQRFGEFRPEIPGSETNLYDWLRTPVDISRNGDFLARQGIDVYPCGKGKKRPEAKLSASVVN